MTIRVLICDESAVMRAVLGETVSCQPDMELVGNASDQVAAREIIRVRHPDVVILDADMPRLGGPGLADGLAGAHPAPLVIALGRAGNDDGSTSRARAKGAARLPRRPRARTAEALHGYAREVVEHIRGMRRAARAQPTPAPAPGAGLGHGAHVPTRAASARVIVIGASTGGTEAIKEVLQALPAAMPPILVVQHMPEMFTPSFARRLDGLSALRVKEAEDGEPIAAGSVYLAPGHSHLALLRSGGGYHCVLSRAEPVNRHRPSVDVLFHSAAEQVGAAAIGVLLTGMGKDGARGLLALRQAGAWTVAQDRDSCVVYGMPREAVALGAAHEVLSLHAVAGHLLQQLRVGTAA